MKYILKQRLATLLIEKKIQNQNHSSEADFKDIHRTSVNPPQSRIAYTAVTTSMYNLYTEVLGEFFTFGRYYLNYIHQIETKIIIDVKNLQPPAKNCQTPQCIIFEIHNITSVQKTSVNPPQTLINASLNSASVKAQICKSEFFSVAVFTFLVRGEALLVVEGDRNQLDEKAEFQIQDMEAIHTCALFFKTVGIGQGQYTIDAPFISVLHGIKLDSNAFHTYVTFENGTEVNNYKKNISSDREDYKRCTIMSNVEVFLNIYRQLVHFIYREDLEYDPIQTQIPLDQKVNVTTFFKYIYEFSLINNGNYPIPLKYKNLYINIYLPHFHFCHNVLYLDGQFEKIYESKSTFYYTRYTSPPPLIQV